MGLASGVQAVYDGVVTCGICVGPTCLLVGHLFKRGDRFNKLVLVHALAGHLGMTANVEHCPAII